MEKLLIPNRKVQVIGYYQGDVSYNTIEKDLNRLKCLLENNKYDPKVTKSFKDSVLTPRHGVLYLDGHEMSSKKGNFYCRELDYGHNVPRFCELFAYSCKFYTIYFLAISDSNLGDMEKYASGEGVQWGSDFFWNFIA